MGDATVRQPHRRGYARGRLNFFRTASGCRLQPEALIFTIDQLPESRRAILVILKQRGPATIAALAAQLDLTGEAVRQQLLQLQREGWIESRVQRGVAGEPGRTGRPATTYALSAAGDHLFPKHYDVLTIAMIDAVSEKLGPDAVKAVLEHVADDRVAAMEPILRELPLPERIDALKNWYLDGDPYMTWEGRDGDYRLMERNCPFYNTAMTRPALCSVSVNALTRLLGVRVEREEKFQAGDGRCVFLVRGNEPVDASRFEFRLES
ncbi:MAG TPA: winged helix-turn-helix transcriptional regulator [Thermoanaerobaculia bacterium]|nr:winged helix-turn-helix transcriptional regulator [Thermoanaerobaculia bacterium]